MTYWCVVMITACRSCHDRTKKRHDANDLSVVRALSSVVSQYRPAARTWVIWRRTHLTQRTNRRLQYPHHSYRMQSNAQPASANDDNYVAMPYSDDPKAPKRRSKVSPMSNSWDKRWVSGSGKQAKSYTVYSLQTLEYMKFTRHNP